MLYGHDQGKNIIQLCDGTNDLVCVKMGGTGKASHTSNAVLTGNGESAVKNVAAANGALYATAANGAPKFGTLPIAQGGTGKTTAAAALKALGGISWTLVYENPSTSSPFPIQKLPIDLTGYDLISVIGVTDTSSNTRLVPPVVTKVGLGGIYVNAGGSRRYFRVYEDGINFDAVYPSSATGDCIPYLVYGGKGVL